MATQETAIRKRQQIANANRMMFLWVAGVSAVVGVAIVASLFLLQKAWFNEKILAEKSKTASTLVQNNEAVEELKNQVRVLNTNKSLQESMTASETQPVQAVLDALPAEANSSALGASLQEKLLKDSAVTLESLNVDPVQGVEAVGDGSVEDASEDSENASKVIDFRFSVSVNGGNGNALKELLRRLERSIRAINVTNLSVETQSNRLVMSIEGEAYYEPAKTVELKDKTVRP